MSGALWVNAEKIVDAAWEASRYGTPAVLTPEMSLTGYPLDDLLGDPDFTADMLTATQWVIANLPDNVTCFFGAPTPAQPLNTGGARNGLDSVPRKWHNSIIVARKGHTLAVVHKTLLPTYGVFEDARWFAPNQQPARNNFVTYHDCALGREVTVAVLICEDMWDEENAATILANHPPIDYVYVANASPYEEGKYQQRARHITHVAALTKTPVVYVNMVGGQDGVVYDGGSHLSTPAGAIVHDAGFFTETVTHWTVNPHLPALPPATDDNELTWQALTIGLKDYVESTGLNGVVLGLSGGLDSALAAAVAVDALGADRVLGVLMPGPFSSASSITDAQQLAERLNMRTVTLPITSLYEREVSLLNESSYAKGGGLPVALENVQARLRALHLMTLANIHGLLVVNTGNKSEASVGYFTLGGDSSGGYAVLQDVYKTRCYELAYWRNRSGEVIPVSTLVKPPSAELAADQQDTDTLPDYPVLDEILRQHLEEQRSVAEICAGLRSLFGEGDWEPAVVRVIGMVHNAEHKRRQVSFGPKVTRKAYTRDRKVPVMNGWRASNPLVTDG